MIELRKIIWASDGSDESENALNYATLIAKKYKSEILGVYVSIKRLKNLPVDFRHLSNKCFYSLVQRAEENRTANFNSVATKLASQGITFEGKVIWGEKSKKILEIAGREKADLIVMGTRGHGFLYRSLIGSTILDVLRDTKIPVLAYKTRKKEKIKKILVPINIFEESDSAIHYSFNLARTIKAKISFLYIVNLGILDIIGTSDYDYQTKKAILDQAITDSSNMLIGRINNIKLNHMDYKDEVEIRTEAIYGLNPGTSIADYATNNKIDLIVIQMIRKGGIRERIFGSVTKNVIQQAQCSVLALPS